FAAKRNQIIEAVRQADAVDRVGAVVLGGAGQAGNRAVEVPALEAGLGIARELLGEREDAHRGEVGRAEFKVVAGPGAARLELAEVGVAGFQREVAVELEAAEGRERGVLVVVGALVDQGLAGAHAGVEAGVLGLGRKRGAAEQQGGKGGGEQLGTHGCLLVWGMSGSLRRAEGRKARLLRRTQEMGVPLNDQRSVFWIVCPEIRTNP